MNPSITEKEKNTGIDALIIMSVLEYNGVACELLGHDAIRIQGKEALIYNDPYALPEGCPAASIILLTHPHFDHCSPEDIKRIATPKTVIIGPQDALDKLNGSIPGERRALERGERTSVGMIEILAVAAYNTDKKFHPEKDGWLGFIVTLEGVSVYFAGDTDLIPEMRSFPRIDVAFLPVSGTYVMTADEAAEAVGLIKPVVAVPMHYGVVVGSESDASRFAQAVKERALACRVEILRRER